MKLKKTKLILELDIGMHEAGRLNPKDYEDYLFQSDHLISEMEIINVVQQGKAEEE